MSIEYMFVKEQRKKETEKFSTLLQEIKNHCKQELATARRDLSEMADSIDSFEFDLEAAIQKCGLDCYGENEIIGTSTSTRFVWRMDNGFCHISLVEEFLASHPGWHIEDEYGTVIPLAEFQKIAQKGQ